MVFAILFWNCFSRKFQKVGKYFSRTTIWSGSSALSQYSQYRQRNNPDYGDFHHICLQDNLEMLKLLELCRKTFFLMHWKFDTFTILLSSSNILTINWSKGFLKINLIKLSSEFNSVKSVLRESNRFQKKNNSRTKK